MNKENFWGQIDPFLTSVVLILLSAFYALPKIFPSDSIVHYAFYSAAAFLILFDAYARGMFRFPDFLVKGPLAWPLVVVTGLSLFITLWLAIPYLVYELFSDLFSMQLDFGASTLFLQIVSFVALVWYANSLFTALELLKKEGVSKAIGLTIPQRSAAASKPRAARKARGRRR